MPGPNIIFEVLDKDGVPVRLFDYRLRHIERGHAEAASFVLEMQSVIRSPSIITLDKDGTHHLSKLGAVGGFRHSLYLEVVIRYTGAGEDMRGEVVTAHFNRVPPKGRLVWMRKS